MKTNKDMVKMYDLLVEKEMDAIELGKFDKADHYRKMAEQVSRLIYVGDLLKEMKPYIK